MAIIVSKPGTGVPMVVSWRDPEGNDPYYEPYNYRNDVDHFRRYI